VSGVATAPDGDHAFTVHFTDGGDVVSCEVA
jgi:hypothetical protein